jgi:hypothetical protein
MPPPSWIKPWERYGDIVVSLPFPCDDQAGWRRDAYGYGDWGSETSVRFPVAKVLGVFGGSL